jgi:hypothetical protein
VFLNNFNMMHAWRLTDKNLEAKKCGDFKCAMILGHVTYTSKEEKAYVQPIIMKNLVHQNQTTL